MILLATMLHIQARYRSRLQHNRLFLQYVADRLNDELRLLQMDIVFALFGDPKLSMR